MKEYIGVITKAEIEVMWDSLVLCLDFKFGTGCTSSKVIVDYKKIVSLMNDANVQGVSELVGKPLKVYVNKGVNDVKILKEAII